MSEVATREPQLRFPEFSDSLIKGALGDYALIKRGAGSQYIEYSKDSKDSIRLIRIGDFLGGDAVFVRLTNAIQRFLLDEGDILIAGTGATAGITFLVPTKFVGMAYSYNAPKIKVHKDNVSFFYQYLISPKIKIQQIRLFTGNAQPFLDTNAIKGFSIFKPPLQEQQKIAAFLAAVDSKIEQLSKKQALLGEYKKGLMQQIFSQAIRFKADDGSAFPVWEEKKLGDIGHTFNGLTGKTKDDFGRGKPYIQYMQIFESSKINIDNFGLVDVRDDENQKVAQYGDVFFTTSSETPDAVGYSSVLLDDIDKLYLNSFCFGFRPNSIDELSPNFAQFLLRSANFRRRVVRLAQGSTRYNMSKVQLMKEVISLPCLKEQTKIAIFLSSIDSKIEQVGKQLDESKQFKKALLQQMFV